MAADAKAKKATEKTPVTRTAKKRASAGADSQFRNFTPYKTKPVSYTHLTLPTICSV